MTITTVMINTTNPDRLADFWKSLLDDKTKVTKEVVKLGGKLVQAGTINNIVADVDGNQFCIYTVGKAS